MRDKLSRRADITIDWAKRTPRVKLVAPKGAFYAHPTLDIPEEDLTFVTDLLKQKHVLVVHGSGFGEKPGTKPHSHCVSAAGTGAERAYEAMTEFMQQLRIHDPLVFVGPFRHG